MIVAVRDIGATACQILTNRTSAINEDDCHEWHGCLIPERKGHKACHRQKIISSAARRFKPQQLTVGGEAYTLTAIASKGNYKQLPEAVVRKRVKKGES